MVKMQKKYPLLISTIVSCVIIIISLFILGFCGIKLGVNLGGGTRFEVCVEDTANVDNYYSEIKEVLSKHGCSIDSSFMQDKYSLGAGKTEYIRKNLVIQIAKKGISAEERENIRNELISALEVDESYVSSLEEMTSSIRAKSVLFIALALGIVSICFFAFGWIRYDIFAAISFIISYFHNIILFMSLLIITRVQLTLMSLAVAMILTLLMSVILISIYEKFREVSKLQTAEKMTVQERMISCEKIAVKPYFIILCTILLTSLVLMFIPSRAVLLSALGMIIAIVVTVYTTLIIGPGSYMALLDIREMNRQAILSRNDTVNKAIKKKIQKNNQAKINALASDEKPKTVKSKTKKSKTPKQIDGEK